MAPCCEIPLSEEEGGTCCEGRLSRTPQVSSLADVPSGSSCTVCSQSTTCTKTSSEPAVFSKDKAPNIFLKAVVLKMKLRA